MARQTFRSLRIPNYRLYFFGQIVSMTGTWVQVVAEGWLVYELTGSGIALGVTTALNFGPILLFGAWTGVVADRLDKRKLVIVTQSFAAVIALVLGVLTATGAIELWMIYVLGFLLGCATALEIPARQSFVMEMVDREDMANAVGLNTTVFTSARVIGPAVAAVAISTVGIAPCFFVNAMSFAAVITALVKMDRSELRQVERTPRAKGQAREGLRYVWSKPELRGPLLMMAAIGTLAYNFRVLLPLMASEVFSGGAGTYGTLSAVTGGGTLAGALFAAARSRPTRRLLVGSATLFGTLMVLAGGAPSLGLALALMVPLGAVSMTFVATANSTLQLNADDAMRGRVMSLWAIVFLGSTPIGGPLVGWIAEAFGTRVAFYVAGTATVATGSIAAFLMRGGSRKEEVPAGAMLDDPQPALARRP